MRSGVGYPSALLARVPWLCGPWPAPGGQRQPQGAPHSGDLCTTARKEDTGAEPLHPQQRGCVSWPLLSVPAGSPGSFSEMWIQRIRFSNSIDHRAEEVPGTQSRGGSRPCSKDTELGASLEVFPEYAKLESLSLSPWPPAPCLCLFLSTRPLSEEGSISTRPGSLGFCVWLCKESRLAKPSTSQEYSVGTQSSGREAQERGAC